MSKRLKPIRIDWDGIGAGKYNVGVKDKEGRYFVACETWSRRYAMAVIRKLRKRGVTEFVIEAIEED